MSIYDATWAMIDELHAQEVKYLLVGSLAASFYGLSRSTSDADFVLELEGRKLAEIVSRLGSKYQLEPQGGFEIVTGKRVDVIYVVGTPYKIDVFPLSSDPFDQSRFGRRVQVPFHERLVCLPTAEDVVVMKIRWRRPIDLEDAKFVIGVQGASLDWPYIEQWCGTHGTRQTLDEVRRDAQGIVG